MFKELEKKYIGIVIKSNRNGYEEHRVAIACACNADFCASGAERERKMQEIVNEHAQMHEATGRKVQKDKCVLRSLMWKRIKHNTQKKKRS